MFNRRVFIFGGACFLSNFLLLGRLYYLQGVNNKKYKLLSDKNKTRTTIIEPLRGKVIDSNGEYLANNKLYYNMVCDPEIAADKGQLLECLSTILSLSEIEQSKIVEKLYNSRSPFIIYQDLDWSYVEKVEYNLLDLPGVYIESLYKRYYPLKEVCSHVIGYVGSCKTKACTYSKVGKSGIESKFDDNLQGKSGFIQYEVNSLGHVVRELYKKQSTAGQDIRLSLDGELNSFIFDLLQNRGDRAGSVVVLDVRSGNVLGLSNFPSYDNNIFSLALSQHRWKEVNDNKNMSMINRAIASKIPPGSTFKLMIALAALEFGIVDTNTIVDCKGYIEVGNREFKCWKRKGHGGHGKVSLNEAIASSCNVYFYEIAKRIDLEALFDLAMKFGLGSSKTGVGLQEELGGVLPDKKWRTRNKVSWHLGDVLNTIIGHGYVLVTPIQLAVMTARIATGMKVVPYLDYQKIRNFDSIDISHENLATIRRGMLSTVNSYYGTARFNASRLQKIAGKTGTAQVVSSESSLDKKDHSLFVGYAPYDLPKYAIAVLLEHGSGAAAISQKILDYLFRSRS